MRDVSFLRGFNPPDGVRQQRGDILRKVLGARLIVHLTVVRESRQSIGPIPKARDEMAYRWHRKSRR
jgi:hypothetical protein